MKHMEGRSRQTVIVRQVTSSISSTRSSYHTWDMRTSYFNGTVKPARASSIMCKRRREMRALFSVSRRSGCHGTCDAAKRLWLDVAGARPEELIGLFPLEHLLQVIHRKEEPRRPAVRTLVRVFRFFEVGEEFLKLFTAEYLFAPHGCMACDLRRKRLF